MLGLAYAELRKNVPHSRCSRQTYVKPPNWLDAAWPAQRHLLVWRGSQDSERPLSDPHPVDGSSSADPARDSPERKASHSGARRSFATACTRETGVEERQSDHADYLYKG